MGVKNLWPILDDIQKHIPLYDLSGQILAIDLSIWIVEANQTISKSVKKPYLRHIFFRVWNLLKLNIIPVVVVEGKAPDLKQEVIKSRLGYSDNNSKPITRTRLNSIQKECCEMLDYLGVPHVTASGEAEAMCAYLNYNNLVDACITNDGDAFLYGAINVYRNFTTNKEPSVSAYSLYEMESKHMLSRKNLIGFGILCGCDYLSKGVPGCGPKLIAELIKEIKEESLIESFQKWHKSNYDVQILAAGKIENNVCLKAKKCPGFPFDDIVNEFLINRNRLPQNKFKWSRPDINQFIKFAVENLEWSIEYSLEKIIVSLSFFELTQITSKENRVLFPNKILKSVIRSSVKSYAVEWKKIEYDNFTNKPYYITCEDQKLIKKFFPDIVQTFEEAVILNKKTKKGKSKKTCNEVEQLSALLSSVNITSKPSKSIKNIAKTKDNTVGDNQHNYGTKFSLECLEMIDEISSNFDASILNSAAFTTFKDYKSTDNLKIHSNSLKSKRRSRSLGSLNDVFTNDEILEDKFKYYHNFNNEPDKFDVNPILTPSLKSEFCLDECLLNNIKTPSYTRVRNFSSHTMFGLSNDVIVGNFNLESSILCFTPLIDKGKSNINIGKNSVFNFVKDRDTIDPNKCLKSNFNPDYEISNFDLKCKSNFILKPDKVKKNVSNENKNEKIDNYYDLPLAERLKIFKK